MKAFASVISQIRNDSRLFVLLGQNQWSCGPELLADNLIGQFSDFSNIYRELVFTFNFALNSAVTNRSPLISKSKLADAILQFHLKLATNAQLWTKKVILYRMPNKGTVYYHIIELFTAEFCALHEPTECHTSNFTTWLAHPPTTVCRQCYIRTYTYLLFNFMCV